MLKPKADFHVLDVQVSPGQVERALAIYADVIAKVEASGGRVRVVHPEGHGRTKTVVDMLGEEMGVTVLEGIRTTTRGERPATRLERLADERWRSRSRDYHPTGRMELRLYGLQGTGLRQRWKDSASALVETRLTGIVGHLLDGARRLREDREASAKAAAEREEKARIAEAEAIDKRRKRSIINQTLQLKRRWTAARELRES